MCACVAMLFTVVYVLYALIIKVTTSVISICI